MKFLKDITNFDVANCFAVIDFLKEKILSTNIDQERTYIKEDRKNNFLNLFLRSNEDKCCPIIISIGIHSNRNKIYFYYHNSGALYEDYIKSVEERKLMIEILTDYLSSEVVEEIILFKGKQLKFKYHYTVTTDEGKEQMRHTTIKKVVQPWKKREKVIIKYLPWI